MGNRIGCRRWIAIGILAAFLGFLRIGQAEAGRVRGTVVDREGKPATAAKVWATKVDRREPFETHDTTADDSGAFSIDVGQGAWAVSALRGHEGSSLGVQSVVSIEDGRDPAPMTIRLRAPSNVKGRVIDAGTGQPITKGWVLFDSVRRVDVGVDGRFEAPGLGLASHQAYPVCPSYEFKRVRFDTTSRPDAELELKLQRAGTVVGRVLDESGKPIPGATVGWPFLWQKCSEDGRFSAYGVPLSRGSRLSAHAPGYLDQELDFVVDGASTSAELQFVLRPDPAKDPRAKASAKTADRRSVSGVVVGPDGKPVGKATVRWGVKVDSRRHSETTTDEQGAFRLDGLADAPEFLSVLASGLTPSFPVVDAGGNRFLRVELQPGATVRGRVQDASGAPIGDVQVLPQADHPNDKSRFVYLFEQAARTDRDGRFTLTGMPESVTCDIMVDGWGAERRKPLSLTDESKNVFTLRGEGAIRGHVYEPSGKPARNFRIVLQTPKVRMPADRPGSMNADLARMGVLFTRDDGEFTLSGLTPGGLYHVTAIAEGFGRNEVDRVEARSLEQLEPDDTINIALRPSHALRVRAFGTDGKPVEGAWVTVIHGARTRALDWRLNELNDSAVARVDARGWAEFPALSLGSGIVVVRAKGFARRKVDWSNDEEELLIDLEPESQLTGTVVDASGTPVEEATIRLSWGDGDTTSVPVARNDGRFMVNELGAGPYLLHVMPSAGSSLRPNGSPIYSSQITLEPGKTLRLDIRVEKPTPGAPAAR